MNSAQDLLLFCLKLMIESRLIKNKCTVSAGYYDTFIVLTQVCVVLRWDAFSFNHLISCFILSLRKTKTKTKKQRKSRFGPIFDQEFGSLHEKNKKTLLTTPTTITFIIIIISMHLSLLHLNLS